MQSSQEFSNVSFKSIYNILFKRNLLLDGRLFLNSKQSNINSIHQGIYINNIFYFDCDTYNVINEHKWPSLCSIRIIQTISNTANTSESLLKQTMAKYFDYDLDYIDSCLFNLLNCGIFETKCDPNFKEVHYKLTKKGEELLDFIFTDFDLLYFIALDTPLPTEYVLDEDYFLSHNNSIYSSDGSTMPTPSNYSEAAIKTAILFIRTILYNDKKEREKIDDNNAYLYELPIWRENNLSKIINRIEKLYEYSSDKEKKSLNNYIELITRANTLYI